MFHQFFYSSSRGVDRFPLNSNLDSYVLKFLVELRNSHEGKL